MKYFNHILTLLALVGCSALTTQAHASGAKLPNADKRIEWSKVNGVYSLAAGSSASCDKDTQLEIEVIETTYDTDPTVMVYNLTNGQRAGRPRNAFTRINQGEDSRTVDGVDGKHMEVTTQMREGWTLLEKHALYGGVFDPSGPKLPKDFTETNFEFDLFNDSFTTCRGVFEYHITWKSISTACSQMTPVDGPCTYKKASLNTPPAPTPAPLPTPLPSPTPTFSTNL